MSPLKSTRSDRTGILGHHAAGWLARMVRDAGLGSWEKPEGHERKTGVGMEQDTGDPSGRDAGGAMPRRRTLLALLAILALATIAFSLNRYVTPAMVLSRYDLFRAYVDGHFASALLIYMGCYLAAASLSL